MVKKSALLIIMLFLLSFFSFQASADTVSGSFFVSLPPWGQEYNFLFYSLGDINLAGGGINIQSNDASWNSNGWPGVVLDKIFFSPASANTGGIFTADVALTIPGINGGNPFPAVINPDILDSTLENTSGEFTGDSSKPDTFTFTALPVYAIVPYDENNIIVDFPTSFMPWDYSAPLDSSGRTFSLALVGILSLSGAEPPSGTYDLTSGSFTAMNISTVPIPGALLLVGSGLIPFIRLRRKFRTR